MRDTAWRTAAGERPNGAIRAMSATHPKRAAVARLRAMDEIAVEGEDKRIPAA